MGFIGKKITLIKFKPPPPTLTLTNHVSIVKFVGMMWIIVSLDI
jgi:hypothetical protein